MGKQMNRGLVAACFSQIAKDSKGKFAVTVDKPEPTSERTSGKPIPLENV